MKINKNQRILVVDDDQPLNVMICKYLEKQGFKNVKAYYSGEELFESVGKEKHPIIIQDYELPGINGVEILKKVKSENPSAEFIFLSGQSSIDVAVEAIKYNAFDYIIKDNFAKENVATKISNLLKIKRLTRERQLFKSGLVVFVGLFIFSWIYFLFFYHS
jgi:DNA-binding NtrC family response regulator